MYRLISQKRDACQLEHGGGGGGGGAHKQKLYIILSVKLNKETYLQNS